MRDANEMKEGEPHDFADFLEIMEILRSDKGCPWDRAQTLESLVPFLREESEEVIGAIAQKNPDHLCEELGDLLYQIVFQTQIAKENGWFDMSDVVQGVSDKMIRRHPHVFGNEKADTVEEVNALWKKIKEEEKKKKGQSK